ncbi:hypothetical protein DSO57_1038994 [Entomophthora muscae]|uniref:Uncharacterized protein n=1 Tax=Entomophthora muscae TaxID=34485 RepID=A0ACC2RDH2_9FUNG|nr:hypothetical protein DSO57_1038994 [Entomophthora muscae]
MTPPLTLRPNRPQESVATDESIFIQIFGVMYIILRVLIDSMVPLAPILWWALPTGPAGRLPASSQEPPTGWIPDTHLKLISNLCVEAIVEVQLRSSFIKVDGVESSILYVFIDCNVILNS